MLCTSFRKHHILAVTVINAMQFDAFYDMHLKDTSVTVQCSEDIKSFIFTFADNCTDNNVYFGPTGSIF